MREEKFLGRVLVQGAENAVMSDQSLEFAAQGIALNPVHHITTYEVPVSNITTAVVSADGHHSMGRAYHN